MTIKIGLSDESGLIRRSIPCHEKPKFCESINIYSISSKSRVTISNSMDCQKCFLLNVELEKVAFFDQQDFIDIDLSDSVKEITGWSYPVSSVDLIGAQTGSERWRIGFENRASLKNSQISFSVKLRMKKRRPIVQGRV